MMDKIHILKCITNIIKKKIPSIHFLNFRPIKGGFFFSGFVQFLKKWFNKNQKKLIDLRLNDISKFVKKKKFLLNL